MSWFENYIIEQHPFNNPNNPIFSKSEEKQINLENQSTEVEFNSLYPNELEKKYSSEYLSKKSTNSHETFEFNVQLVQLQQFRNTRVSNEDDYEIEVELVVKKKSDEKKPIEQLQPSKQENNFQSHPLQHYDLSNSNKEMNHPFSDQKLEGKGNNLFEIETNTIEINKKNRKPKVFQEQQHSYKNFVQYLGKKVFSIDKDKLEKFISNKYKNINYQLSNDKNSNEINLSKYEDWIDQKDLKSKYNNMKTFREIWTFNEKANWIEQHFKMVLTKITKDLLKYQLTRQIMEDSKNNKYMVYNLESYLNCIPTFLSGIKDPNSFYNIKEN